MNNNFYDKFKKIVVIEVTGKNIYNYINKLVKENIKIYDLKIINIHKLILKIDITDYLNLEKKKTIYNIKLLNSSGILLIKEKIKKYKIFLIFIILGFSFIIFLSNIIFDIEVIHTNKTLRQLITKELSKYGLVKYSFKKDYQSLENITNSILLNNKDQIEWLEIINKGTKYIIKVEERKLNKQDHNYQYQNIVATKNGIIKRIEAKEGEIIKIKNDYVEKGDIIISGTINLPNNSRKYTKAEGIILGEVWYTALVKYPYIYQEEKMTGKTKNVYVINMLGNRISLFDYQKYNTYHYHEKILFESNMSLFQIVKEQQYEINIIDEYNTKEEAIKKAIEKAVSKINETAKEQEKIIDYDILQVNYNESEVTVKIFIKMLEIISEPQKIISENE